MRHKQIGKGRDIAAPSDPNNTGAQGTLMGLSGGSLSQGFDNAKFQQMLGNPGDIAQNPFGTQPNPATSGGNLQQRLDPGEISVNDGQKLPIDGVPGGITKVTHGLETGRALSPEDYATNSGVGNLTEQHLADAPSNAVDIALNAGDAEAVTQGYFSNTRKNIRQSK